jgi:diaminopropionate ammonia-lyase
MNDSLLPDVMAAANLLWVSYQPTRLIELPPLAQRAGVGRVLVKVEGSRPFGNFKVLGGMTAGLCALARASGASIEELLSGQTLHKSLPRLICASDGNHGLAVAAAAQRAGADASVYLPRCASRLRADRITAQGAEVIWVDGTYDDAVDEAAGAALRGDGLLISDTSSDPDDLIVHDVMAGYGLLTTELVAQCQEILAGYPTHLFVQAGVGGLAAAMADGLCTLPEGPRQMIVVEPTSAACVGHALALGHPERLAGDLHTCAEMLACGLASASAVRILLKHEARSITVSEEQLRDAVDTLRDTGGPATTPSGAAGLAGFLHVAMEPLLRRRHDLDANSTVLLVTTEADASPGNT